MQVAQKKFLFEPYAEELGFAVDRILGIQWHQSEGKRQAVIWKKIETLSQGKKIKAWKVCSIQGIASRKSIYPGQVAPTLLLAPRREMQTWPGPFARGEGYAKAKVTQSSFYSAHAIFKAAPQNPKLFAVGSNLLWALRVPHGGKITSYYNLYGQYQCDEIQTAGFTTILEYDVYHKSDKRSSGGVPFSFVFNFWAIY